MMKVGHHPNVVNVLGSCVHKGLYLITFVFVLFPFYVASLFDVFHLVPTFFPSIPDLQAVQFQLK